MDNEEYLKALKEAKEYTEFENKINSKGKLPKPDIIQYLDFSKRLSYRILDVISKEDIDELRVNVMKVTRESKNLYRIHYVAWLKKSHKYTPNNKVTEGTLYIKETNPIFARYVFYSVMKHMWQKHFI